jgi:hypothetical protein
MITNHDLNILNIYLNFVEVNEDGVLKIKDKNDIIKKETGNNFISCGNNQSINNPNQSFTNLSKLK